MKRDILGYMRPDGQVGIRNKVAIIYTVHCSMFVAEKIHRLFPENTQVFGYPGGCVFKDGPANKIVALGKHSQYGGVLVVGLGCEGNEAHALGSRIAESGKPVESIKINEEGGDLKTIEKGARIMLKLLQHTSQAERVMLAPADLIVGAECGGSDATSGLASNPAVGFAADLLIDAGGTYMHSEVPELMGCGDALAARAINEQVAQDIKDVIAEAERESFACGSFSYGYGNQLGGLTSIEEKSYGALAKSGSRPLQGVLHTFGLPPRKGYWIQVGEPGAVTFQGDPEGVNQRAACGAHLNLFTTGCGSTTGGLVPVIKVIANPNRPQLILDNADIDASPVILGEKTIAEVGREIYQEILAVAAGKLTKSEMHQHYEA
jgi:altronate dehydratase large subunit